MNPIFGWLADAEILKPRVTVMRVDAIHLWAEVMLGTGEGACGMASCASGATAAGPKGSGTARSRWQSAFTPTCFSLATPALHATTVPTKCQLSGQACRLAISFPDKNLLYGRNYIFSQQNYIYAM